MWFLASAQASEVGNAPASGSIDFCHDGQFIFLCPGP